MWRSRPFGVRRLVALIDGLPPGSAVHRAVAPEWWPWGFNEELLANLIEQVDLSNRLYVQAHSKPGTRPPKAVQVPRPYDRVEQPRAKPHRRRATPDEIIDMFSGGGGKVVKS